MPKITHEDLIKVSAIYKKTKKTSKLSCSFLDSKFVLKSNILVDKMLEVIYHILKNKYKGKVIKNLKKEAKKQYLALGYDDFVYLAQTLH